VTQCQVVADPVSGCVLVIWLYLWVPWLGCRKKPERKNEEMKGGRLGGSLRGAAAPATILTDGAAHQVRQVQHSSLISPGGVGRPGDLTAGVRNLC
jgi:hypothetical protein